MKKKEHNRIRVVMAEKNRTNNWLAEQLNVSRNTVSKWCRNEMQPRIEMLFKIANALDVSPRDLLSQ